MGQFDSLLLHPQLHKLLLPSLHINIIKKSNMNTAVFKTQNGEMTFLNMVKTSDSLFFGVSSCYFFAFYEPAKLCSAHDAKINLTNLVVPSQLSLSVRDPLQSPDLSRSKDHSSLQGLPGFQNGFSVCPPPPPGGGGGGTRPIFRV